MTPLSTAFDPRLTAEALVESGQIVLARHGRGEDAERYHEEARRLMEFGITLAEIDALPEVAA